MILRTGTERMVLYPMLCSIQFVKRPSHVVHGRESLGFLPE